MTQRWKTSLLLTFCGLASIALAAVNRQDRQTGAPVTVVPGPAMAPAFVSKTTAQNAQPALAGTCASSGDVPSVVKDMVDAAIKNDSSDTTQMAGTTIHNMILIVGNANGELYRYQAGYNHLATNTATACDPVRIMSGSKWLVGLLAMRMVEAEKIALTDKASKYFTFWTTSSGDNRSKEELRFLLAQDGGFDKGILVNGCTDNGTYTLQQCAQQIYNNGLTVDGLVQRIPGQKFDYGAQDLQLAAAMLEKAGGDTFPNLLAHYVTGYTENAGTPIMPSTAFIDKISGNVSQNAYAAGGAVSTADDYANLLHVLFKGHFINDLDTLLAARTLNPDGSDLPSKFIPPSIVDDGDWRYALGHWAVCHDPDPTDSVQPTFTVSNCGGVKVNSSPGLNGWTPWIDRVNGYWALIATDTAADTAVLPSEGDTFAVPLMRSLEPVIARTLPH